MGVLSDVMGETSGIPSICVASSYLGGERIVCGDEDDISYHNRWRVGKEITNINPRDGKTKVCFVP